MLGCRSAALSHIIGLLKLVISNSSPFTKLGETEIKMISYCLNTILESTDKRLILNTINYLLDFCIFW